MSRKSNQNSLIEKQAKRRRKNANESIKTPLRQDDIEESERFEHFEPSEYELFSKAHKMVEELVFKEGPYRSKLLLLADRTIRQHNETSIIRHEHSNVTLVKAAWEDVVYGWCPESHPLIAKDKACAFTLECKVQGKQYLPLIVFCSKFKVAKTERQQEGFIASKTGRLWSLLFFFRKIKHEFLHAVQRYLAIKYENKYDAQITPDYMTPYKGDGKPEAGDYDEEEDSGGQILPFNPMHKFSNNNPLCLYYIGRQPKFIKLNIKQVEALLDLDLYMFNEGIESRKHSRFLWCARDSRAYMFKKVKSHFDSKFFEDSSCFSTRTKANHKQKAKSKKADPRLSSPGIEIMSKASNDRPYAPGHMWRYLGARSVIIIPDPSKSFAYWKKLEE